MPPQRTLKLCNKINSLDWIAAKTQIMYRVPALFLTVSSVYVTNTEQLAVSQGANDMWLEFRHPSPCLLLVVMSVSMFSQYHLLAAKARYQPLHNHIYRQARHVQCICHFLYIVLVWLPSERMLPFVAQPANTRPVCCTDMMIIAGDANMALASLYNCLCHHRDCVVSFRLASLR
jgi:hypothetical protein